jgi:hypothetical protein
MDVASDRAAAASVTAPRLWWTGGKELPQQSAFADAGLSLDKHDRQRVSG